MIFRSIIVILMMFLCGCQDKVIIPVPSNFCPKKVNLHIRSIDISTTDSSLDEIFKKIHLEVQAKQWAIDRFQSISENDDLPDDSIKIDIKVKGEKNSKNENSFFSSKVINNYKIQVDCACSRLDTNGNVLVTFEVKESGNLMLENATAIDEINALNDILYNMLRKIDNLVIKKMYHLKWVKE